jgi:outer membrane protein with beta-barrel domain
MQRGGLVVLVALAIAPAVARAQSTTCEHPIAGGIQGGLNASTWAGADDASIHLGALLGGFATFHLIDRLALQAEIALSDKGADFEDASGEKVREALLYLELPVMARYDLPLGGPVTLHGLAGPGLAILTDSKRTPREDLRPLDLTMTADVGVDLAAPSHLVSFDLRLGFGLLDAVDDRSRKARAMVVAILGGVTL